MGPKLTPQLRWAFAEWNVANIKARQAYSSNKNSTHNQPKNVKRERQADGSRRPL